MSVTMCSDIESTLRNDVDEMNKSIEALRQLNDDIHTENQRKEENIISLLDISKQLDKKVFDMNEEYHLLSVSLPTHCVIVVD